MPARVCARVRVSACACGRVGVWACGRVGARARVHVRAHKWVHVRSSLVAIISLPIGILVAFIVMRMQGINANIMSLGGIAVAIGTMIDGAIVMIENMHKHMEKTEINDSNRWEIVTKAATEVGPALFFSLLIITVSY